MNGGMAVPAGGAGKPGIRGIAGLMTVVYAPVAEESGMKAITPGMGVYVLNVKRLATGSTAGMGACALNAARSAMIIITGIEIAVSVPYAAGSATSNMYGTAVSALNAG